MTVKIIIKNLGALKQAELKLGDLTVICGGNNTGKTYATYAIFGFLSSWRRIFSINIQTKIINKLLEDGVVHIDIKYYAKQSQQIITKGCQDYTQQLPKIFATSTDRFQEAVFDVIIDNQDISLTNQFTQRISTGSSEIFSLTKSEESTELVVTFLVEKEKEKEKIPIHLIKEIISDALKEIIFAQLFPNPFIASAERTGAAIFRKELNFARNRLLEEMGQVDKNINPIELLLKDYGDYALPIKQDVEFIRQLESLIKNNSFIAEEDSNMLADFADIIGGKYTVTRDDQLSYVPNGKRVKLSMDESSSAVRSLLGIGFYLRHEAKRGDLLIVDEPELNLHPENQRRVARLFAYLTNLGIKVFITTHSDYIVKEMNTLIMLNQDKPYLRRIAEEENYRKEELLSSDKVKVYIAEEALILLEGRKKRTRCQTLQPADIDPELGIEARSFDTTIETMNRIQEAIIWGED